MKDGTQKKTQFDEDAIEAEILRSTNQKPQTDFLTFDSFSDEKWIIWIDSFLNGESPEPPLIIGRIELHHALLDLWDNLSPSSQRRFSQAVASIFETTPAVSSNSEKLFYVLQMLSRLKPVTAKRFCRRVLAAESLKHMRFGERDLHLMVAATTCEYDIDDDLIYLLRRSADREPEFLKVLVYFRLMAKAGGKFGWSLFGGKILPGLVEGPRSAQVARILRDLTRTIGYKSLAEWYVDSFSSLSSTLPDQVEIFHRILTQNVLSENYSGSDAHLSLLSLLLRSAEAQHPQSLVELARLEEPVGGLVARALKSLWERCINMSLSPWRIVDPDDPIMRAQTVRNHAAVVWIGPNVYLHPDGDATIIRILREPLQQDLEEHYARFPDDSNLLQQLE